jgi:hypothetical protein
MQYIPGRSSHVVPKEYYTGFNILDGGKLAEFLERTTRDGRAVQPEDGPMHNDDERLPANPITSGSQGVTNLTQFTIGEL